MMIVSDASSVINKLEALFTDDIRVVIYDHHVFIVQATGCNNWINQIIELGYWFHDFRLKTVWPSDIFPRDIWLTL
jgi:hypothetical protein